MPRPPPEVAVRPAPPPAPPAPVVDEEGLGALPTSYESDSVVALARDPRTLFVFWSFGPRTLSAAAAELDWPVTRIRVFDGDALIREEPCSLEARNWYLGELPSGRTLRVELVLVGRDGQSRRLGPPSAPVTLPSEGPAVEAPIRFMKVDPETPLAEAEAEISEEITTDETQFLAWERIPLPGSAEGVGSSAQLQTQTRRSARRLVPPPKGGEEALAGVERGWSPSASGQGLGVKRRRAPGVFVAPPAHLTASGQGPGVSGLRPARRGLVRTLVERPERGWVPPTESGQGPGVRGGAVTASGQGPGVRGGAVTASGQGPGIAARVRGGALTASGQGRGLALPERGDWAPALAAVPPGGAGAEAHAWSASGSGQGLGMGPYASGWTPATPVSVRVPPYEPRPSPERPAPRANAAPPVAPPVSEAAPARPTVQPPPPRVEAGPPPRVETAPPPRVEAAPPPRPPAAPPPRAEAPVPAPVRPEPAPSSPPPAQAAPPKPAAKPWPAAAQAAESALAARRKGGSRSGGQGGGSGTGGEG
ncbi:MAG TPA: DUF4912 domain-containing protein [Myxococcaceae bacterium]|nr:DUF4912 domain-containing protein [Myxococcaceae bacterium]